MAGASECLADGRVVDLVAAQHVTHHLQGQFLLGDNDLGGAPSLMAAWETSSTSAARLKLPSRTIVSKVISCG